MAEPDHDTSPPPPAPPPLDIVALDDDADFREFLFTLLESGGHELRTASTPSEFYAACEDRLPDIALLDMNMGEDDGTTVLEQIRQRWPRLCVIVITGYPSLDTMRQTFKQQVFDYLAKPFGAGELDRALAQAAREFGLGQRPQDRLRAALGRQIRLARTERGWTLKELSEVASVSVSQLSSIERGAHLPSMESLLAIAQALGKTPSHWLDAAGF
ncbi:MAG: DNA-binding NtrC family response regulator [Phycisphaerales bacterium]|jgi:DNA-binding NtrC family response regulator